MLLADGAAAGSGWMCENDHLSHFNDHLGKPACIKKGNFVKF